MLDSEERVLQRSECERRKQEEKQSEAEENVDRFCVDVVESSGRAADWAVDKPGS